MMIPININIPTQTITSITITITSSAIMNPSLEVVGIPHYQFPINCKFTKHLLSNYLSKLFFLFVDEVENIGNYQESDPNQHQEGSYCDQNKSSLESRTWDQL